MKYCAIIILIGILISCNNSKKTEPTVQNNEFGYVFKDDSIEIPFFEIEVKLSEAAEKKLKDDNESVIVDAIFGSSTYDLEKVPEEYIDRIGFGGIGLLDHRIELTDTRLARFEKLEFPKSLYDSLEDKDILINVNVYSGRRSSENNLLGVDALTGPISKIKEKRFTLNGGLLGDY